MRDLLKSSIVKILDRNEGEVAGAGVLIGKKWVLTCRHVITAISPNAKNGDIIYLNFFLHESEKSIESKIILLAHETEPDIAILELEEEAPPYASIGRLAIIDDFWDRKFKLCGFSSGMEGEWVSAVGRDKVHPNYVQIDVSGISAYKIEEGFSGTPVFDAKYNDIVGIVVCKEIDPGILSGGFIPINTILEVCKKYSIGPNIFEFLDRNLDLLKTPLGKIASLIVTRLQSLEGDKERKNEIINEIIEDIEKGQKIYIPLQSRDGYLFFPLAMTMLNLGLSKSLKILRQLRSHELHHEDLRLIVDLLVPSWVDSETAARIYERAIYEGDKKAVALNANDHFSAEMCVRRASSDLPKEWPTYSCLGKFGINAADDILREIEELFKTDLLKSGRDLKPNELRSYLRSLLRFNKTIDKPTFFILNYSENIASLLLSVQEIYPCITLFLLTGDSYPQQDGFGDFDCKCLLNLGLDAERQVLMEISLACDSLQIPNVVTLNSTLSVNYEISQNIRSK